MLVARCWSASQAVQGSAARVRRHQELSAASLTAAGMSRTYEGLWSSRVLAHLSSREGARARLDGADRAFLGPQERT